MTRVPPPLPHNIVRLWLIADLAALVPTNFAFLFRFLFTKHDNYNLSCGRIRIASQIFSREKNSANFTKYYSKKKGGRYIIAPACAVVFNLLFSSTTT